VLRVDRRAVVRFAVRLAVVLALCWAPWPRLGETFAGAFAAAASQTIGSLRFDRGRVALEFERSRAPLWPGQPSPAWHAIVTARNMNTNAATRSAINLRAIAYVPATVFLALTLAFPLALDRRWALATLLGAALVGAFIATSVALSLLGILMSERVFAVHLGPAVRSWLTALFFLTAETNVAAPAVLFGIARVAAGPLELSLDAIARRLRSLRVARAPAPPPAAVRPRAAGAGQKKSRRAPKGRPPKRRTPAARAAAQKH
jgi:hypothetical protein